MKTERYQNLTNLRKEKHLSMKDMADKLHMSTAYYCQLETKKKRLSYDLAIKISKILDLNPDDVFFEEVKQEIQ